MEGLAAAAAAATPMRPLTRLPGQKVLRPTGALTSAAANVLGSPTHRSPDSLGTISGASVGPSLAHQTVVHAVVGIGLNYSGGSGLELGYNQRGVL